MLTLRDFRKCKNKDEFLEVLKAKEPQERIDDILYSVEYEKELIKLQGELVDLQQWVAKHKKRVAIIFEGRDAAGK